MNSCRLEVHEHEKLVVGGSCRAPWGERFAFSHEHWDILARYAERTQSPSLHIGHKSIKFTHHVGYLRIGPVHVEVLPKLRRSGEGNWRGLLMHMLREVLGVRLAVHQATPLRSRAGDLYSVLVARYLDLVRGLLREGLTRAYREVEGNETCMRGRLLLARHLRVNAIHRERLYLSYPVFDADTLPNRMLQQALAQVVQTSGEEGHRTAAEALLGIFPVVGSQQVRPADFDRLRTDRSTARYTEALELARLILSAERPDLRWGGGPVLSLMFDMNALFEAYVLRQVRRLPGSRRPNAKG